MSDECLHGMRLLRVVHDDLGAVAVLMDARQIAEEIYRRIKALDGLVDEYAAAAQREAQARCDYEAAEHRATLDVKVRVDGSGERWTVAQMEARAAMDCLVELRAWRGREAEERALRAALQAQRSTVDALRTLAANERESSRLVASQ